MKMKLLSSSIKVAGMMLAASVSVAALADVPVITEVTTIRSVTWDSTPAYVLSTDKAGTIIYGGDCTSRKKSVVVGNNTITFSTLSNGVHNNCTITVKDAQNNLSNTLSINAFRVDTVVPTISLVSAVPSVTEDLTPSFTVNVSEAGTLKYSNTACASLTTAASISGNQVITLKPLRNDTTYSTCGISIIDAAGNKSAILTLPTFVTSANNTSANPKFVFAQTTYVGATNSLTAPWWKSWAIKGSVPTTAARGMNGAGTAGYTAPATTFASVTYDNSLITPLGSCPASVDPSHYSVVNAGTYDLKGKTFQVCRLSGDILVNVTLTNDVIWSLNGRVNVGDGNKLLSAGVPVTHAVLTVQRGTVFRSLNAASLVVTRGSKINARGTAKQPIILWSDNDDDFDDKGQWGGLVIQGYAYNNLCDNPDTTSFCNIAGEGASGYFGGRNNADNSGVLKFVVIAEAGSVLSNGNELNGIGFMGVGYGTVVDYVQVHKNADDGFEFFGGAVDARHLVSTSNDDDNIDWDEGYVGNIQWGMIVQTDDIAGDGASHAFEMDTKGDAKQSLYQESNPTVANVTALALLSSAKEAFAGYGMQLKEGTEGHFVNILMMGDWKNLIRFEDNTVMTSYASVDDAFTNVYGSSTISNAINYNTSGYTVTSPKLGAQYNSLANSMAENDGDIPIVSPVIESLEIDGTAD